ncbi:DUF806 family protein [Lactiplantibacillus plantarum]|uniref:DUF806 family protein n=1 Tax=Lactiplantibacillus plantarum TaxID=1590 RepID=UPI003C6D9DC6
MTPANQLRKLIQAIPSVNADHVHAFLIPKTEHTQTEPIIVVSEIDAIPSQFGSNDFDTIRERLQVQIYVPDQYTVSITDMTMRMAKILRIHGYYLFESTGITRIPDTGQELVTLKFNHEKEL